MKKIFIVTSLLLFHIFVFGQAVNKLPEQYYLDIKYIENFEKGSPLVELKERSNYELFLKVSDGFNRGKHPSDEERKLAYDTKEFKLKKGDYALTNEYQKFRFVIDEKGLLTGGASLVETDREFTYYWNMLFENGELKEAELKSDLLGMPKQKIDVNDSLIVLQYFDFKTGEPNGKRVIKNRTDYNNSIDMLYYDNGNLYAEENRKLKILKKFHKNGKPESYLNSSNNESIKYDEMGRKVQHSYPTKEGGWCEESYGNGLITTKNCNNSDNSIITRSHYKNGKLDNYQVQDRKKSEYRNYDKNNNLLKTEKIFYKSQEQQN